MHGRHLGRLSPDARRDRVDWGSADYSWQPSLPCCALHRGGDCMAEKNCPAFALYPNFVYLCIRLAGGTRLCLFAILIGLKVVEMEYMSQEGYDKLVAELRELELVKLPEVREAIAEARDKGDLSENFEYHAAKREQGRLLSRIRFKRRVLENARVIDRSAIRHTGIGLLSVVTLTNVANGAHMTYTIVSPHEANMSEGKISLKSLSPKPCSTTRPATRSR